MERPILFSTEMVRAILEGRKSQTRRIVKSRTGYFQVGKSKQTGEVLSIWAVNDDEEWQYDMSCPYGEAGDGLYVREEHYQKGKWVRNGKTKTGKEKWKFVATHPAVLFGHNKPALFEKSRNKKYPNAEMWYKRLARFMPKTAARIFLEITDIRVERLQEISEEDAIAEGVQENVCDDMSKCPSSFKDCGECCGKGEYFNYSKPMDFDLPPCYSAVESFESLWQSINGEQSWSDNPWVWVIQFKKVSTNLTK